MRVLVTGGAGYIGSHIVHELSDGGHTPIILDSLRTGKTELIGSHIFYQGDIADLALLEKIVQKEKPDSVIHCAALIVVPESEQEPALYYRENVSKSLLMFEHLAALGIKKILFSSSASVYGHSNEFEVDEHTPLLPGSPYARTKLMMEYILEDFSRAFGFHAVALRYFNPIGADKQLRSGMVTPEPTHVLGRMLDVALGKIAEFTINGVEYDTRDGSAVRDFIHVSDVAQAHVAAVENFPAIFRHASDSDTSSDTADSDAASAKSRGGFMAINIGTGRGTTVRELLRSCKEAIGVDFAVKEAPPRPGDVIGCYANCRRAHQMLSWASRYSITEAIQDHFRWLKKRAKFMGY